MTNPHERIDLAMLVRRMDDVYDRVAKLEARMPNAYDMDTALGTIDRLRTTISAQDKTIDRLSSAPRAQNDELVTANAEIAELRELVKQYEKEVASLRAETHKPENMPTTEAVGIWPNIEIVRTENEQPVPSHGGPARSVTWTLCVNGIAIDRANKRFEWGYTGSNRYETPGGLLYTKDLLEQALHGKTHR